MPCRLKTRTSTIVPVTPGGKRRDVSRTSAAFSPKIARSSFSSGVIGLSPFGVTLPTRMSPGVTGTVVDVRVFSRRGVDKDERAMAIERSEIERLAKDRDDEKAIQERSFLNRLREKLLGRKAAGGFK